MGVYGVARGEVIVDPEARRDLEEQRETQQRNAGEPELPQEQMTLNHRNSLSPPTSRSSSNFALSPLPVQRREAERALSSDSRNSRASS